MRETLAILSPLSNVFFCRKTCLILEGKGFSVRVSRQADPGQTGEKLLILAQVNGTKQRKIGTSSAWLRKNQLS
jgi:hypothetical protein